MFDPDRFLAERSEFKQQTLFYPSCGPRWLSDVMAMDCRLFVFSDKGPRDESARSVFWNDVLTDASERNHDLELRESNAHSRLFQIGDKWGLLFFLDNNEALSRIQAAGCAISCFVGICDGCREGGNYECVNEPPFLDKLLSSVGQPLRYITEHSPILVDREESERRSHTTFRTDATVACGSAGQFHFALNSVLVRTTRSVKNVKAPWPTTYTEHVFRRSLEYEIFRPPGVRSVPSASELLCLTRYRAMNFQSPIAQYDVWRADGATCPA